MGHPVKSAQCPQIILIQFVSDLPNGQISARIKDYNEKKKTRIPKFPDAIFPVV
jgi:hypothetical protein